jgi:hypothetical protein
VGEFWQFVGATLLGALVSFGATFYFEWRKERRVDKKEQQKTERQLLEAGRLVYEELNNAWIVLNQTSDTELWWSSPPYNLESSAWGEYKATLAELLDIDTWSVVSSAYSSIGDFNRRVAIASEGMEVPSPILEVDEGSEPMLEPIQGKFVTDAWHIEVLDLYGWVDRTMDSLGRQFISDESMAKQRMAKQKGNARHDAGSPKGG